MQPFFRLKQTATGTHIEPCLLLNPGDTAPEGWILDKTIEIATGEWNRGDRIFVLPIDVGVETDIVTD